MSELLKVVYKAIDEKKGEDIVAYDFTSHNPFIDEVIITSVSNLRQVYAIADNICDRAKEHGFNVRSMEGDKDSRWILVDLDSVVAHVFLHEERDTYKLERLWSDLPRITLE